MITTARGTRVYQGKPCAEGHTEKYLSSRNCVTCTRARTQARNSADPEKHRAESRLHHAANRERKNAYSRRYFAANRERLLKQMNRYDAKRRAERLQSNQQEQS